MPPKDDPQADIAALKEKELRVAVCREYRRGLTQRNIAGGLGITPAKVQKILSEDLERLFGMDDESREAYAGYPLHGTATLDAEEQDLKESIRKQRAEQAQYLIDQVEVRGLPPSPEYRSNKGAKPNPEKVQALPYTITNFPVEKALVKYSLTPKDQLMALQHKVFTLRKQGKSYQEIEQETGVEPQAARRWVQVQLSVLDNDELHNRDLARRMQLERLDSLLAAVWPSAIRQPTEAAPLLGPDLEAIRTVLRIMERQSKLLGLDSPTKIDIEDRVRRMARAYGYDEDEVVQYTREAIQVRLLPDS